MGCYNLPLYPGHKTDITLQCVAHLLRPILMLGRQGTVRQHPTYDIMKSASVDMDGTQRSS
jgi:hypothetical protein